MRERTDWGKLMPGEPRPEDLPVPPATGSGQPLLNPPAW
jgi:hypothetical protein